MHFWAELVVALLLGAGGFFMFVGSFALVKLPTTMQRLHGPTKATTLGIGALLLASMSYFTFELGVLSIHELLIALFLVLTAPVTALMVAKVHRLFADDEMPREDREPPARRHPAENRVVPSGGNS
jgi:multicomponent K+:H+ antiporter subunit G